MHDCHIHLAKHKYWKLRFIYFITKCITTVFTHKIMLINHAHNVIYITFVITIIHNSVKLLHYQLQSTSMLV